ncbi:MAG TPA: UGSC family (seleno)protein [Gammaproteobacteria bacterium]|nr:UGSC family (seleno)protein [Gammaproteobacteria bacterium]
MALEQGGVPTVAVHTHSFARLARSVARANGMPTTRQAFVPQPVVGKSAAELRAYIEGADPISKQPFAKELIDGLTQALAEEDVSGLSFERSTPRLLPPDTEESLRQLFIDNQWTDYQPILLPTEERVEAMLAGTSRGRDEIVGRLRPTVYRELWEFTVEKVAVNAVMAGAKPEYLPVILAMAASGQTGRSSSTTSQATVAIVNGPIRDEIGMNSGVGAMSPYNQANATIGRAYGLLSQNLQGGSVPHESYMGSQGNFLSYNALIVENEAASPWEPFHVQHGKKPSESTVSLLLGGWYTIFGGGPRETWQEKFTRSLQACDPFTGPVIALDPLVARGFVELGFDTKEKLIEWCVEHARLPAREYWDNQWIQTLFRPRAAAGIEPYASMLKAAPDEMIRMFRPEDIHVVVVGGETGAMWKMIGGGPRLTMVDIDPWR